MANFSYFSTTGYSNLVFDSSYSQLFANCRDDIIYQFDVINNNPKPGKICIQQSQYQLWFSWMTCNLGRHHKFSGMSRVNLLQSLDSWQPLSCLEMCDVSVLNSQLFLHPHENFQISFCLIITYYEEQNHKVIEILLNKLLNWHYMYYM